MTATPSPAAPSARDWAQLGNCLEQDRQTTARLHQLLTTERQALAERDYEAMATTLGDKQRLLEQLEQSQQQRHQWLQRLGLESEAQALALARQASPELAEQWQQLASDWQRCQQLNQGNDHIARRTYRVVQDMLARMRGSSGEALLYDASGQARRGDSGQPLADA